MTRPGVFVTETTLSTPVDSQPVAAAAGALVASLPSGPTTPTRISSWYQFSTLFGGLDTNFVATFGTNLFFRAGGGELFVQRVINDDATAAEGALSATDAAAWITFTAKGAGAYGNNLRVQVALNAAGLYDVTVLRDAGVADSIASGLVTAGSSDDLVLETFSNVKLATWNDQEIINILSVRSQHIDATWNPAASAKTITASTSVVIPLATGSDGSGTLDYDAALTALGEVSRTLVLFSPGETSTTTLSALDAFAAANGGFLVADTDAGTTPAAAVTFAGTLTASAYTAVYYPHLWVPDPTSASRDAIRLVPPSGAVAGAVLATDSSKGVFKAPAGLDTAIGGVVALERTLSASQLDALNDAVSPVNAIRTIAGVGPAIMGARTLKATDATKYVNIRRSLSYLTKEMDNRLEFALFRNNDLLLWNQMKTALDSFLTSYWTAGGLRGGTKAQAYYIKIDSENNSPTDIANGIVNAEIGVSLQFPAEFIKVKLTQQTATA